ncbi:glycosyltransferase family protein [Clostridium gasigenes]|uniref:glycosyltransferase family protein n=1 Tax=Clostridium gasigenes TaxID=94869 RepID=UPI0014385D9A|nr:glycosyltransferase family protein [Clostridium gasigenes]MBB6624733.1 hypothetical protein [Clostridium gasigenes]MBU3103428.1 glycosyltransferase family protein [Clostridium gasigenes]MBU3130855.1 glycosyltransferase family protein [Clostridium gasigenes]MBU3136227.1 glycosyltransferase family protein [Clostridium gasigenes]NKF07140.1 hypothetical protein [Clostridium gasigenes]
MDDKKIAFIIVVNNELAFEECKFYISNLIVPNGFNVEVIPMRNANGIAFAYNQCMESSTAKYKVYLHQDVYIRNMNFINDLLNIFNLDKDIGLIGMCGAKTLPASGVWWESSITVGRVYESHTGHLSLLEFNKINSNYEEIEAVDGLLIATQYDLKWRDDIFKGWHFYDLSQCLEFINKGYKVVVPRQETPWCVHDCGLVNTSNGFDFYRDLFLKTYKS